MAFYINRKNTNFFEALNSKIYVDKSMLIEKTNENLRTNDKFMCVTRPRRFGKTMALSMLNAYYSKGCDSKELFTNLKISNNPSFGKDLNNHNVIWVDMAGFYVKYGHDFLKRFNSDLIAELDEMWPNVIK